MKKIIKTFIKKVIAVIRKHFPKLWHFIIKLSQYILKQNPVPFAPAAVPSAAPIRDFSREDARRLADYLAQYDLISFDVFDTLVLRAFDDPKMIFQLWGQRNHQNYAHKIRINTEHELRLETGGEVLFQDIYKKMEACLGIPAEQGMAQELELELYCCMPNPYIQEVYNLLRKKGKRIIITTDMYLPKEAIEKILNQCGYEGWEALYVSSGCQRTKKSGAMWTYLNGIYPDIRQRIHVGDNPAGDGAKAEEAGWHTYCYKNLHNINGKPWKKEMAEITGSLYRGLIDQYLYSGAPRKDPLYELGFVYYGLPLYGYCQWLHELAENKDIDLILFAARDMYAVHQVFSEHYDTPCEYLPISRKAILRAVFDKCFGWLFSYIDGTPKNLSAFQRADIERLFSIFREPWLAEYGIPADAPLSAEQFPQIRKALLEQKEAISAYFSPDHEGAVRFFTEIYQRHRKPKRIMFVDMNGRGTCLMGLRYIFQEIDSDMELLGALVYSGHREVEAQILDRSMYLYIYSQWQNEHPMKVFQKKWIQTSVALESSIFTEEGSSLLSYAAGENEDGLQYSDDVFCDAASIQLIREGVIDFSRLFARYVSPPGCGELHVPSSDVYYPLIQGAKEFSEKYPHINKFSSVMKKLNP